MGVDMFLKIDGIQGESTDNSHKDEIDLLSYTWGESHEPVSATGGGAAGAKVDDAGLSFCHARQQGLAETFLGLCK